MRVGMDMVQSSATARPERIKKKGCGACAPVNAASVIDASDSQPSFCTHPGPPHPSAEMSGGSAIAAHADGWRRRSARSECKKRRMS